MHASAEPSSVPLHELSEPSSVPLHELSSLPVVSQLSLDAAQLSEPAEQASQKLGPSVVGGGGGGGVAGDGGWNVTVPPSRGEHRWHPADNLRRTMRSQ